MILSIILIFPIFFSRSLFQKFNPYFKDLVFAKNHIQENHPGVYNQNDPNFNNQLEKNYRKTINKMYVSKKDINVFMNSFKDNHCSVIFNAYYINNLVERFKPNFSVKKHKDLVWIKIPSFHFDNNNQDFQNFLSKIPKMRNAKAVVFDLRANGGGNSNNGDDIIKALFGKDYANEHIEKWHENEYIDFRASSFNIQFFEKQKFPYKKIIDGMKKSYSLNAKYFRFKYKKISCSTKHNVKAKIIVIIDKRVASASLDFIDSLLAQDYPICFIGEKTSSDRLYMNCSYISLPNTNALLLLPIQYYGNRRRGDNESYYPNIYCDVKNEAEILKKVEMVVDSK
jgi:hypothetical protein